jgi:hypothetical protein
MTTYFHADSALLAQVGTRHVLGVAKALNYRHGYFNLGIPEQRDQ